ncbi:Mss4-like protein [Suillus clintonianus]|uniref:Mss4-like protein n=1 Tax=Suillus clintonianus TaxID=1904413 RepID=UPI001B87B98E|nr:Mss4-like protein [Suillus clintonianus]KAG2140132.1 Mss4-like protein [Suillus clintonianus]
MSLATDAHTESQTKTGPHSSIHHTPPEDHTHQADKKSIPDTGWRGSPPIPSSDGGDSEKDWMSKPPYNWSPARGPDGEELFKTKYESSCWCGAVRFAFAGDPFDAKHCHCRQCQRLHGAPFQWAAIFPKTSVRILQDNSGALHCFSTTTKQAGHHVPCKVSCDICRAPLFDEGKRMVLAYPSGFKFPPIKARLNFQPSCHIFYGHRVMEVCDGIPKWRGHKNDSELMQEMSDVVGIMPRCKGYDDKPHA